MIKSLSSSELVSTKQDQQGQQSQQSQQGQQSQQYQQDEQDEQKDITYVILNRSQATCYHYNNSHVFISITAPGVIPVELPDNVFRRAELFLSFDDIENVKELAAFDRDPETWPIIFNYSHANKVMNLLLENIPYLSTILINCDSGVSKSPAVAAAIDRFFGGDGKIFFEKYQPNNLVFKILYSYLYNNW